MPVRGSDYTYRFFPLDTGLKMELKNLFLFEIPFRTSRLFERGGVRHILTKQQNPKSAHQRISAQHMQDAGRANYE
jgi:hypothetical protein